MKASTKFWISISLIWILSTCLDRFWWTHLSGIPAWDQADYLNSALSHARSLGFVPGGNWQGWNSLLDHSPKIPPLASIVNGSVIALGGDSPAQAAWSLSIWNGVLLFSVAAWCLHLRGQGLGLIAVSLIAIAPASLQLRSNYLLELPLTAVSTLTLWRLSCWLDPFKGGKWWQALIAFLGCTASLLTKQSSLLILLPTFVWTLFLSKHRNRINKFQVLGGLGVIGLGVFPWLSHNWITTIGGTNRAVFEAAARENDPSVFTLENWTWYINILPKQVGLILLLVGLSGCLACVLSKDSDYKDYKERKEQVRMDNKQGWWWLLITMIGGWFFTTLSPNKDARYITPLLPMILILLSRGWLQWVILAKKMIPNISKIHLLFGLIAGFSATFPATWKSQLSVLNSERFGPLESIVKEIEKSNPKLSKTTVIVVPSTPDLNQHNFSYYGRRNGGQLLGRQLGSSPKDIKPVLAQSKWIVLAEGDQGSVRQSAISLDKAIRTSGIFSEIRRFPRKQGGNYSIWKRDPDAIVTLNFANRFPKLAKGLELGPQGLNPIFSEIAVQHMLDGHFKYQDTVRKKALKILHKNPNNIDSLWTLALLEILSNRPQAAAKRFSTLEILLPSSPWPSAYHSIVSLADWNPWKAASLADQAQLKHNNPLLEGIGDLSGIFGGAIWRLPAALTSIPNAIRFVDREMYKEPQVTIKTKLPIDQPSTKHQAQVISNGLDHIHL